MSANLDELFAAFQVVETIHIDSAPKDVWRLISDVERIVEFSPECVEIEWLGGATAPQVGARFAGTSRVGSFEWIRNCTITALQEPECFAYEVADEADEAAQSRWSFEVAAAGNGTNVTQRFLHVPTGRSTVRLLAEGDPAAAQQTIAERAAMLSAGMRRTLEAMRAVLESKT
jgi:uncharacterized protein YndB with AHSA1/START domain